MTKALITGGAWFIGSHLAEVLPQRGWPVIVLDDLSTGSIKNVAHPKAHLSFSYVLDSLMNRSLILELIRARPPMAREPPSWSSRSASGSRLRGRGMPRPSGHAPRDRRRAPCHGCSMRTKRPASLRRAHLAWPPVVGPTWCSRSGVRSGVWHPVERELRSLRPLVSLPDEAPCSSVVVPRRFIRALAN